MISRLHPQLKLTRTLTGRLATAGFPVLGLPKGSEFRGLVRAPKGFVIYEADYSQIELRTAAQLSRDPVLVDVYKRGDDLHAKTAYETLGAPIEKDKQDEVTERRPAKVTNFSMLMGTSPMGLTASIHQAGNLAWSKDCPGCKSFKSPHSANCDSANMMKRWFGVFKGVRTYMDDCRAKATETGFAEGMWGMRWFIPGVWSPHEEVREAALRQSHALPVQEGAERLKKQAMRAVWEKDLPWAEKKGTVEPLLTIHDSLLFLVETDFVKDWHRRVRKTMSAIAKWIVPIEADGKFGSTWLEMEKM